MALRYTVIQGDYLAKIADRFGFMSESVVWNDPLNDQIRAARPNPEVLLPGDVVVIPDKVTRIEEGRTERRHVFRVKGPSLRLRLRIEDRAAVPRCGLSIGFAIEGDEAVVATDGDGIAERRVLPSMVNASLSMSGEQVVAQIGYLDPVDFPTGWRARLNNLGYAAGDGTPSARDDRSALEEFQCDAGLAVTGQPDGPTLRALLEAHGS